MSCCFINFMRGVVVNENGEREKSEKAPVPPRIEEQARCQQHLVLPTKAEGIIQPKHDWQKNGEGETIKYHARRSVFSFRSHELTYFKSGSVILCLPLYS